MTSSRKKAPQLGIWRGEFGNGYTERNAPIAEHVAARTTMWARILEATTADPPASMLEVGANIGLNLRALTQLTEATLYAVEPNAKARTRLVDDAVMPSENAFDGTASALPFADRAVDLVFTSGVLIHIHPDDLPASVAEIHRVARRYIVCVEYFADQPETIPYRGHTEVLFKRDFGSFWLDGFPDLRVLDYGFFWKRLTGLDNLTWWLFEKGD